MVPLRQLGGILIVPTLGKSRLLLELEVDFIYLFVYNVGFYVNFDAAVVDNQMMKTHLILFALAIF